jgi:hypothetical protein
MIRADNQTPTPVRTHGSRALAVAMIALSTACGGESITVGGPPPPAPSEPTPPPATAAAPTPDPSAPAAEGTGDQAALTAPVAPTYRDEDFVEAETNRDPFRNFAIIFVPRQQGGTPVVQRRVLMDTTSVDEIGRAHV